MSKDGKLILHHSLSCRNRRDLRDIGARHDASATGKASVEVLVKSLSKALLEKGEPNIYQCSSGLRVPSAAYSRMLHLLRAIRWKRSAGSINRSAADHASSLVLGATAGPVGFNGFSASYLMSSGASRGINRRVVPAKYRSDEPELWELWQLCKALLKRADPQFHFSSIQVNRNFPGAPHVDRNIATSSYALSLGDFSGGRLVAATDDPHVLRSYDTKGRLTRFDGRHPHWVTPHKGERFSLIFYRFHGRGTPRESNLDGMKACRSRTPARAALPHGKR